MTGYFIHPRFMATLAPLSFPNTGKIQQAGESQDPRGQTVKAWIDYPGLTGLACRIETTGGNETKGATQVYATATHQIYMDGFYPQIDPSMRFVDQDGLAYDILAVNQDSFGAFTLLIVEVKH
jgi:hypothetical protein